MIDQNKQLKVSICLLIMYTLFKELYQEHCGTPQFNISLLGLEKTGKTQILRSIKNKNATFCVGLKQQYKPTVGLNTTTFDDNNMKLLVWDLGGKRSIRKLWESYYPYTHGFIFLFDQRYQQGIICLSIFWPQIGNVLSDSEMSEIPCLILIRNSQIKNNIQQSVQQVESTYDGTKRQFKIELLPHSREKLYQQLEWLYEEMRKMDKRVRK